MSGQCKKSSLDIKAPALDHWKSNQLHSVIKHWSAGGGFISVFLSSTFFINFDLYHKFTVNENEVKQCSPLLRLSSPLSGRHWRRQEEVPGRPAVGCRTEGRSQADSTSSSASCENFLIFEFLKFNFFVFRSPSQSKRPNTCQFPVRNRTRSTSTLPFQSQCLFSKL